MKKYKIVQKPKCYIRYKNPILIYNLSIASGIWKGPNPNFDPS